MIEVILYLNSATTPASMFSLPSTEVTIDRSKDVDAAGSVWHEVLFKIRHKLDCLLKRLSKI